MAKTDLMSEKSRIESILKEIWLDAAAKDLSIVDLRDLEDLSVGNLEGLQKASELPLIAEDALQLGAKEEIFRTMTYNEYLKTKEVSQKVLKTKEVSQKALKTTGE